MPAVIQGEPIPTLLETPAYGTAELPPPPVVTRPQFLPFEKLAWEDFERLCLRYIRLKGTTEFCQPYGVKGQDQEGIDFYVRLSEGPQYAVYQCKRILRLRASDVKDAVTRFLNGSWSETASVFVFCTSSSTAETKFANVFEKQAERLKKLSIRLDFLDRDLLSEGLKGHPLLVDDFFGRAWTTAFCGGESTIRLSTRLDGATVVQYRRKLATFYHFLFTQHDPAIPVRPKMGFPDVDVARRFVLPDVYSSIVSASEHPARSTDEPEGEFNPETGSVDRKPTIQAQPGYNLTNRTSLDVWLSQADRSVILGVPGSGKSALLRFLALDLLSTSPSMPRLSLRWGNRLPVWVPFAYWTNLNSKGSPVSLRECLAQWFKQFDQDKLWPLVEQALEDERLLLLVDGLDEWDSEVAARTASNLLQSFIQERNLATVLVSRPYGFERVGIHGAEWQIAELAPLSHRQQHELVLKWLKIRNERNLEEWKPSAETDVMPERERDDFFKNMAKSADLSQLAETPLLLLLLLYLYIESVPLPDSRFTAYEHVVNHFIGEHPLRKRAAASLTNEDIALSADEIRSAMAYIAATVQEQFPAGVVPEKEIRPLLEGFLKDESSQGLGLSKDETRRVMRHFTNLEEGSLGLLVSQGHGSLSFFHKSLQEFLASTHYGRLPLIVQRSIVKDRLPDPRWREVLLGLIWLCRRNEDAESFAQIIEGETLEPPDDSARTELLAQLAFGDFRLGPIYARELAERVCVQIERSPLISHRTRLLSHVIIGLRSRKTRQVAHQRLKRWIFSRSRWRAGQVGALALWPPDERTWSVLGRALYDEESSVKRAASAAICKVFKGDSSKGRLVAELALSSLDVALRAVAVEGLADGWPDHHMLKEAINSAHASRSAELRIASISARIKLGIQNQEDLFEMIRMSSNKYRGSVDYSWRDEMERLLIRGWEGDPHLKTACLDGAKRGLLRADSMDTEMATVVLVGAFKQDHDAAEFIANGLQADYPFNMKSDVWRLMPANFRDNRVVVQALDEWAEKAKKKQDIHQVELSYAALVGRTETMKNSLFDALAGWVPFWAVGALLKGWGMGHADVADRLRSMALTAADASEIARDIPSILQSPKDARDKLLALMRDPHSRRSDFIVDGFSHLSERGDEDEIVRACLDRLERNKDEAFVDMFMDSLILTFRANKRIRALSLAELESREPPLSAIAQAYQADEELRTKVAELLTPLSLDLRTRIVSELPACGDANVALDLLRRWDSEGNLELKTLAAINYNSLLIGKADSAESSLLQLSDTIPCYGADYRQRRQAALAGLIILRRLDIVRGKTETIGFTGKPVAVELSAGLGRNRVLLACIGKHWEYVKETLGTDLLSLFQRSPGQSSEFWSELAWVGADFPILARDILQEVDRQPELLWSPGVLTMIARLEPRSDRLLSCCLNVLQHASSQYNWLELAETSSALISEHFRNDPAVGKKLELIEGDRVPTGVVMALCKGWPQSPLLMNLQTEEGPLHVSSAGSLYVKYATAGVNELPALLESDLTWAKEDWLQREMLVKPVLARIRNDARVGPRLFDHLAQTSDPDVKATFSRCITAGRALTGTQVRWYRDEIKRQTALDCPEVGFDLFAHAPRAVTICLLESLTETTGELEFGT